MEIILKKVAVSVYKKMVIRKPYIRLKKAPEQRGIIQESRGNILIVKMMTGPKTRKIVQIKRSHVLRYKYL